MHAHAAHRRAALWLAATAGFIALALAMPALSQAEESNPNNYSCLGSLAPGAPVAGSEDQQVNYTFYCNGPVTGYQLESEVPVTGITSPPLVSKERIALPDSFSCSGELPGWAVNCVGLAKGGYENITGEFAIGTKLCAEPRVDTLLSVTYAYLEKGVVTQAISGPFDLGRPKGCPPDGLSGSSRLNPATTPSSHTGSSKKHHTKKHKAKKAARRS